MRTWVEFIGVAAVVVSLGLLTWEINQANSIARFSAYSEVTQQYNDLNLLVSSSEEFAEFWASLAQTDTPLSELDSQRALGFSLWHRNAWNSAEKAHSEGLISSRKYQNTLNDIEFVVTEWPAIKPYLRTVVDSLGKETELTQVERRILDLTK